MSIRLRVAIRIDWQEVNENHVDIAGGIEAVNDQQRITFNLIKNDISIKHTLSRPSACPAKLLVWTTFEFLMISPSIYN